MISSRGCLLLGLLCVKVVYTAPPSEGQEIANKLGDDLSFASKQVIRGFTAIFGPLLDFPQGFSKKATINGNSGEEGQNFQRVLLRDGVNAFGKGVKASATILTVPARVVGTGLEEIKKVGQVGLESRSAVVKPKPPMGLQNSAIEDGTKIASTLLNTTASEFSQANLGAVLVEVALKKRIKDIGNRTATYVESKRVPLTENRSAEDEKNDSTDGESKGTKEVQKPTPSRVDALIERFNDAVKQNDERVLSALRVVLEKINPPKD